MDMHGDVACPRTDPTIAKVKVLQGAGDPQGVLQEIHRLRREQTLSDFQQIALGLHEIGALRTLGAISVAEFVEQAERLEEPLVGTGEPHLLADARLWCILVVLKAGELDMGRDLVSAFYESLPETPEVEIYGDMSLVFMTDADGDTENALDMCRGCLERIDRNELPCLHEFVALHLARLLVKTGQEETAHKVLKEAGVSVDKLTGVD